MPGYPVIERCNDARNCTIPIHHGEVLMCSVSGIWPEVRLEWHKPKETSAISFSEQHMTVKLSGDAYDITYATKINVLHSSEQLIKIGCSVTGPNSSFFDMHSTISLFILDGKLLFYFQYSLTYVGFKCSILIMIICL